ncbi:DUF6011 domain-containing protein [Amycolatopsis eburnea]|uniref:Uncharacterized protein n=1 Tax=Amycolatopsis eburnea TaxID=2267691 RepID=A0A427TFQ3_9PSEU|nr:DUF6011 domain-containing protein [Amycolatopsis eburnea]RSD21977.1 hypothetical protein EIY87_09170 [Amycolatopsis eburnea]
MTTRCQRPRCGRKLTSPQSQRLGYGPVCYRKTFGRPAPVRGGDPVGPAALFELPGAPIPPPRKLSPDRRRTKRQAEAISLGYHPLGVALRVPIPLHPAAAPVDRKAAGLRCGSCLHRVAPHRDTARVYPKCNFGGDWRRATGGAGTDVRAWWPACHDYRPAPAHRLQA